VNILGLIQLISKDIDDCFLNADLLIEAGYDPWRALETASGLDAVRRRYIVDAANSGVSVLALSGVTKLSPMAIRNILDSQVASK
jgi:hypothetical protein